MRLTLTDDNGLAGENGHLFPPIVHQLGINADDAWMNSYHLGGDA